MKREERGTKSYGNNILIRTKTTQCPRKGRVVSCCVLFSGCLFKIGVGISSYVAFFSHTGK